MKKNYVDRILELAKKGYDNDEIPVGAIIIKDNQIIGEGINSRKNKLSVIVPLTIEVDNIFFISSCPTTSSKLLGRYFLYKAK